jgi:chromosomal replication initiation ATPase DnaA
MESRQAQRVIESLRQGIPPEGHIRRFTVGRKSEIARLTTRLDKSESGALLLKANYGSGKTHLLRFIRETHFIRDSPSVP